MHIQPVQLICLIGIDGSGKTTQAFLLVKKLRQLGINCIYKRFRFFHFFSLPLLAIARIKGLSKIISFDDGSKVGYHYFYRSTVISLLYPILLFIDIFFAFLIKIYFYMKFFRKTIVCDRFIYDTIIDIMVDTKNYNFYKTKIGHLFLRIIPKNTLFLMLLADEKVLKKRRKNILYDKTLTIRINLYKMFSKIFKINVINSEASIKDVHENVMRHII